MINEKEEITVLCRNCDEEMYISLMQREDGIRYRCGYCGADILLSLGVDIDG